MTSVSTRAGSGRALCRVPRGRAAAAGGAAVLLLAAMLVAASFLMQGQLVRWLAVRSPDVLFHAETPRRVVALTIDDSPDAVSTTRILDVLAAHDARATFFVIGAQVAGNERVVRRIVDEGHELGNHGWRDRASVRLSTAEFERDLLATKAVLDEYGEAAWFRPGSGWYGRAVVETAAVHGYTTVLGSVYPFDAHVRAQRVTERHVLRNVQPGAIIVLHDRGRRGLRTAAALATILPELGRRGYRVVSVGDLRPDLRPDLVHRRDLRPDLVHTRDP